MMNKPQQPVLGKSNMPPSTAMRRGIGTASGARPMTAVSGAGFSSAKNSLGGMDPNASLTITLEPKIET
jgi:hypothetical protein